jgi:hypothetical protein
MTDYGRRVWTQQQDATILDGRENGVTWHALAAVLKVGRNAVVERGRRLGIKPHAQATPAPEPEPARRHDRGALPPGDPVSWAAITAGTTLEGEGYSQ